MSAASPGGAKAELAGLTMDNIACEPKSICAVVEALTLIEKSLMLASFLVSFVRQLKEPATLPRPETKLGFVGAVFEEILEMGDDQWPNIASAVSHCAAWVKCNMMGPGGTMKHIMAFLPRVALGLKVVNVQGSPEGLHTKLGGTPQT